jgi:hypothetical protein
MSINLGNEAIDAARELHQSGAARAFEHVRDGVLNASRHFMNAALDAGPEDRHMAVGYAKAVRDLYTALEAAAHGVQHRQVEKIGPEVKRAAR